MKKTYIFRDPVQAHKVMSEQMWLYCKAALIAGQVLEINVKPLTRNNEQNALLHSVISDIAKQVEWAGSKHDVTVWKRLLVSAWLRARGDNAEIYPALDGKGIDIVYERTSQLSIKDCAELIEYIYAWGAGQGIVWSKE